MLGNRLETPHQCPTQSSVWLCSCPGGCDYLSIELQVPSAYRCSSLAGKESRLCLTTQSYSASNRCNPSVRFVSTSYRRSTYLWDWTCPIICINGMNFLAAILRSKAFFDRIVPYDYPNFRQKSENFNITWSSSSDILTPTLGPLKILL